MLRVGQKEKTILRIAAAGTLLIIIFITVMCEYFIFFVSDYTFLSK